MFRCSGNKPQRQRDDGPVALNPLTHRPTEKITCVSWKSRRTERSQVKAKPGEEATVVASNTWTTAWQSSYSSLVEIQNVFWVTSNSNIKSKYTHWGKINFNFHAKNILHFFLKPHTYFNFHAKIAIFWENWKKKIEKVKNWKKKKKWN